jgi:hypothetical protein
MQQWLIAVATFEHRRPCFDFLRFFGVIFPEYPVITTVAHTAPWISLQAQDAKMRLSSLMVVPQRAMVHKWWSR